MPAAIRAFFHPGTNTVSYLVWCPDTRQGAVLDPVLDWDQAAGEAGTAAAQAILDAARAEGVTVTRILETHAHADHLTAAPWLKARTGARIGIGARITEVQRIFRPVFDTEAGPEDFDDLWADGARFPLGALEVEVLHVPGHTPADIAYRIGDDVFVGDTLFMHDYGTARCDFPGGDCRALWRSIGRLLALPDHTRLWMCHDYKAPGRDEFAWQSTVALQRAHNPHLKLGEDGFVRFRQERDATLRPPALLLPSIQVNIRAGRFPEAESNGVRYLKLPVKGVVE
ncbi:MBL fold metallo-hydrolase [Roseococcus sp. DSY-14]|uniref:MBL fold metallo-hydrolase n=1 Tax=Roseococcus sp. DSY-14 TaxID=3369650 RepID=UPI00387B564D